MAATEEPTRCVFTALRGRDPGEPPGGFNRGRNDIFDNWVGNGPHAYGGFFNWGNTMRFTQCNGNVAWSDGWVDYIVVSGAA